MRHHNCWLTRRNFGYDKSTLSESRIDVLFVSDRARAARGIYNTTARIESEPQWELFGCAIVCHKWYIRTGGVLNHISAKNLDIAVTTVITIYHQQSQF